MQKSRHLILKDIIFIVALLLVIAITSIPSIRLVNSQPKDRAFSRTLSEVINQRMAYDSNFFYCEDYDQLLKTEEKIMKYDGAYFRDPLWQKYIDGVKTQQAALKIYDENIKEFKKQWHEGRKMRAQVLEQMDRKGLITLPEAQKLLYQDIIALESIEEVTREGIADLLKWVFDGGTGELQYVFKYENDTDKDYEDVKISFYFGTHEIDIGIDKWHKKDVYILSLEMTKEAIANIKANDNNKSAWYVRHGNYTMNVQDKDKFEGYYREGI